MRNIEGQCREVKEPAAPVSVTWYGRDVEFDDDGWADDSYRAIDDGRDAGIAVIFWIAVIVGVCAILAMAAWAIDLRYLP